MRRAGSLGRSAVDTLASSAVAVATLLTAAAIRCLRRPRAWEGAPKLLVLEGAYALDTLIARNVEHAVTNRDLGGFFSHVWTVHPAVGASPEHGTSSSGRPSAVSLTSRHTVIEGKVALHRRLHALPRTNFGLAQAALLLRLHRLVRSEAISLIQTSDPYYLGLLGLLLARANRLPLVVFVYGNFDYLYEATGEVAYPRLLRSRWLEKRIERYVFARADLVVAGNDNNLEYTLRNGASPDRATVFRPGGWIHRDHREVEPVERRRPPSDVGLGRRPYMLLVGRLIRVKHPDDVMRAAGRVRERGHDLSLVLVGSGPMQQELQELAQEIGISSDVMFAGDRDQRWISVALSSADVVLSPFTGLALIEACLSGTPVVAYDVEWQSELVQPGLTGCLVPYRDHVAMADAICWVLENEGEAREMAGRARRRALELMDPTTGLEHQRSQYRRVLETGPQRPEGPARSP